MLQLTADEKAILNSKIGSAGDNMALNIVVKAAEMLGASRLVDITSSHIDGCLYPVSYTHLTLPTNREV